MKKFLSLLLAAMMLLSCTAAMAQETGGNNPSAGGSVPADSNASIVVRETDDRYQATDAETMSSPKTEVWLTVDASGQIDVTVPLVLVFKTDIDGGKATSPDTYKITNHSTSDLVVTGIQSRSEKDQVVTMTQKAYNEALAEDQYKAQLRVNDDQDKGDVIVLGKNATNNWDLLNANHTNAAIDGGLFELKKADPNSTIGTSTRVYVDMETGKLSFVTSRTDADAQNDAKGVYLLTVTYTVAIDTNDAVGSDVTTSAESKNDATTDNTSDTLGYTLTVNGETIPAPAAPVEP